MKIVLVTSQANYVRDNYDHLLGELLAHRGDQIVGLVVIRTVSPGLIARCAGLYAIGVRNISTILLKNAYDAVAGRPFADFEAAGIPVIFTDDINVDDTREKLHELAPDLMINARTRSIYGPSALEIPQLGCINIHHGILPKQRGTMCDLWALYEGRNPGFSIHEMNEKIDQGQILHVHEHDDWDSKNYFELPYQSSFAEVRSLIDVVDEIDAAGRIDGRPNRVDDDDEVIFRTDPDWRDIRAMRADGIVL